MDMLADKLGMDPLEFRLRNSLQPGQSKSTGRVVTEWPFPELLEAIRPHYERANEAKRSRRGRRQAARRRPGRRRFWHRRARRRVVVAVELDPDGGVSVYAAAADPGEGNDSMLTPAHRRIHGHPHGKGAPAYPQTPITRLPAARRRAAASPT